MQVKNNQNIDKPTLLHHYTSIDSLACILKTKKIKLNRLDRSNDPLESKADDIKNFGKFIFYSSWASEKEESIPMWKLYSDDDLKNGIRLSLPKYFYKIWHHRYDKPMRYNHLTSEDFLESNDRKNVSIMPLDEEVEIYRTFGFHLLYDFYTNLIPFKMSYEPQEENLTNNYYMLIQDENNPDSNYLTVSPEIGIAKHERWEFEKEYRYSIELRHKDLISLTKLHESEESKAIEEYQEKAKNYEPPCNELFLHIHDSALEEMVITLSPSSNEGHYHIVRSLVKDIENEFGISIEIKKSILEKRWKNQK